MIATPTNHRFPFISQSDHKKEGNKVLESEIETDVSVDLKLLSSPETYFS
jgi:hypothetical protein